MTNPYSSKQKSASSRGFSLIELAAAVALSLGVAGASLAIITQHTFFMGQIRSFGFIRDEAPQINRILISLLSSSTDYMIYSGKTAAFSNGTPSNSGSTLVLDYRNPSGFSDRVAVVFETGADWKRLNLYAYQNGWPATPNWTITSIAGNITFTDTTGLLTIAMTGPRGEQVTYMGATR